MENLTLNAALNALAGKRKEDAAINLALYEGRHLHLDKPDTFAGYIGLLPPTTAAEYAFITGWLARIFAAANLVKAGVNRNLDAVLSREPDANLIFPDDAAETVKDALTIETTAAFNEWWDERDLLKNTLREIGKTALLEGELYVRPIISIDWRTAAGSVPFKASLADAYDLIDFEIVTADKGGIFRDKITGRKFSICRIDNGKTKEVEISYVGEDKLTYLRILRDEDLKRWATQNFSSIAAYIKENPNPEADAKGIDLGGRLYLHRIRREQLITEPARSLQRSVNYALTTMNKNLNIAGSRETGYGNTQKPKKKIVTKDALGNVTSVKEEDAPLVKGAHNANFFTGIPIYSHDKTDAAGNPILVDYKNPQQFVVDPVAVDTFVKAFEVYRELFLEEISQAHILSSNLTVSGKSKQESRSEFGKSARATAIAINPAGRYIADVVMKLAAEFCQRAGEFKGVRYNFVCQLTVGAADTEEIKQEAQDVKDGLSTIYSYLVKKGVEDPDAVIQQLRSADDYVLSQLAKGLEVYKNANGAIPLATIIDLLPIGDDDKEKLKAAAVVVEPIENLGVEE